jgi:hypothetical protein
MVASSEETQAKEAQAKEEQYGYAYTGLAKGSVLGFVSIPSLTFP